MEITKSEIETLRDQDRVKETQGVLGVIANHMAMPLYLLFWIADWLYVPHLKWEFLAVRLLIIPLVFIIQYLAAKATTHIESQRVALLFNFSMATALNYMVFRIEDPATIYYAGLNLVALGNLAFIPWHFRYFLLTSACIYVPYFLIVGFKIENMQQLAGVAINSFFIVGTIVILFVTRIFNEALRQNELTSKLALENEVRSREETIKRKTDEAMELKSLSQQFSPQVVDAIEKGEFKIDAGVHQANICCIFIDIVNSTNRVTRIEKESVDKVISMFMEDVSKVFLKYDITIDKFLGDGVLGFSNDPVKYDDYVERVVRAALDVKATIANRHFLYESYWLNKFEICVGIANGVANVGFYGSDKYYHSYTAIGPVVNLASRLCSAAEPNQILTSFSVMEKLDIDKYEAEALGTRNLKGFEEDIIKVYEVTDYRSEAEQNLDVSECPECKNILHLDTNSIGHYILKCRQCGLEMDEATALAKIWDVA